MPLRAAAVKATVSERYDARLARSVLEGGPNAPTAAMTLLEYGDPPTLTAAVALPRRLRHGDRGCLQLHRGRLGDLPPRQASVLGLAHGGVLTRSTLAVPRRWRLRSYVLDRRDFNEIEMRLPRAVRRDVQAVPEGHVGLIAQAMVGEDEDLPLAVLYDDAPAPLASEGMRQLEQRLTEMLG